MAVYTEVADDDLERFLTRYGAGELLSYKGIAEGVENTNYVVRTTGGAFILTLYEKRTNREDLPYFLNLKEHLAKAGLPCPVPVRDRDGRTLNELSGRAAALITFLEGFWVRRPRVAHCAAVGRALASLHLAGANFAMRRENALGLKAWRPLFEGFAAKADTIGGGLEKTIRDELAFIEPRWPQGLPQGVIHADLFPDNVFFLGETLSGLIDFYFACNDALAYDVGVCLNAWCFEPDCSFNVTKGRAFLRGYEDMRALTAEEREATPMLARGASLRFLLTRAHDWIDTPKDALVKPHDPIAYLRRLRFHQSVRGIADYGYEARGA